MDTLTHTAQHFITMGVLDAVERYGEGNINDTYLATCADDVVRGGRFILQRINQRVFTQPVLIMENFRMFSQHIAAKLYAGEGDRHWEMPVIVPAQDGRDYYVDPDGDFWRAITFIAGAQTYPAIRDADHAREAGYALGTFHRLISDLPPEQLHDTLKGFHVVPQYLRHYDEVLSSPKVKMNTADVRYCRRIIDARRAWASVLEDARACGDLKVRAIHGDPKVDNIMMDTETGQAISMIDLDTVKPGLVHYDIGDSLRSGCNPVGESPDDVSQVRFEMLLCRMILQGYLPQARAFLLPKDYAYLYDAVRILAFEMGLRFFTDYVEGDVYFKVRDAQHNLLRTIVQFRLLESIETQEAEIRTIIQELMVA